MSSFSKVKYPNLQNCMFICLIWDDYKLQFIKNAVSVLTDFTVCPSIHLFSVNYGNTSVIKLTGHCICTQISDLASCRSWHHGHTEILPLWLIISVDKGIWVHLRGCQWGDSLSTIILVICDCRVTPPPPKLSMQTALHSNREVLIEI